MPLHELPRDSGPAEERDVPEELIEAAAVLAMAIGPVILGNVIRLKYGAHDPPYPRDLEMIGEFVHVLAVLLVLLYIGLNQPAGVASLGIALAGVSSLENLLPGVLALCSAVMFPMLLYGWFRRLTNKERRLPLATAEMMSRYKTPRQRLGLLLLFPFAGVQEEVLYRGYLVLLLGERTGAVVTCAIVSIVLFVCGHLYQGKRAIPFHLWFAVLMTGVTLWTGSILWPLGAHALLNFSMTLGAGLHTESQSQQPAMPSVTPAGHGQADQVHPQVEG